MGYKLYASMGTGDFYAEHGVDVSILSIILLYISEIYFSDFFPPSRHEESCMKFVHMFVTDESRSKYTL